MRILVETAAILKAGGVRSISLRILASRMGITAGELCQYFPSRQDVLLAHFSLGMATLDEQVRKAEADASDPSGSLRSLLLVYGDFALADPARFRLLFLDDSEASQDAGRRVPAVRAAYAELVRRTPKPLDGQTVAADDPKVLADVLWAAVHGAVTLAITAPEMEFGNPKSFVERTVNAVLKGLSQ